MNNGSYAYSGQGFGWGRRAEHKPWSLLEVGAVIGGFVLFWPLGIGALILKHRNGEIWPGAAAMQGPWSRWKSPQDVGDQARQAWAGCGWKSGSSWRGYASTGNAAFDEYRKAKLDELEAQRRKLDEERAAFDDYLRKLRNAKDREDFERFMNERNSPKTGE